MQLLGPHHVTAVTANARGNHAFYTRALGMRLVKKTVNQDDVSAYHLFYRDAVGTPCSDITFFERAVLRSSSWSSRASAARWSTMVTRANRNPGMRAPFPPSVKSAVSDRRFCA